MQVNIIAKNVRIEYHLVDILFFKIKRKMFIKSLHIIIEIHLYIMMPIGINEIEFIIVNDFYKL